LPKRQREVVVLKVFSDMTYEEVAGAMGLSVGAVKAHFHQAVANLRRLMAARVPER
jgi:RNA polymerase sigma factor (sigma-70 family)